MWCVSVRNVTPREPDEATFVRKLLFLCQWPISDGDHGNILPLGESSREDPLQEDLTLPWSPTAPLPVQPCARHTRPLPVLPDGRPHRGAQTRVCVVADCGEPWDGGISTDPSSSWRSNWERSGSLAGGQVQPPHRRTGEHSLGGGIGPSFLIAAICHLSKIAL